MRLNIGKRLKNLFKTKKSVSVSSEQGYTRPEKEKKERVTGPGKSRRAWGALQFHNNLQAHKAKKVRKSRKRNKLARKQRKINAKK